MALNGAGYHPEEFVSELFAGAVSGNAWIWILSGLFGVLLVILFESYRVFTTGSKRSYRLSPKQKRLLSNGIVNHHVDIKLISVLFSAHGGNDSRELANDIASTFKAHGWQGEPNVPIDDDPHLAGVKIWYQPNIGQGRNARRIADALHDAGIEFEWTPHDPPYNDAVLFVYRKP